MIDITWIGGSDGAGPKQVQARVRIALWDIRDVEGASGAWREAADTCTACALDPLVLHHDAPAARVCGSEYAVMVRILQSPWTGRVSWFAKVFGASALFIVRDSTPRFPDEMALLPRTKTSKASRWRRRMYHGTKWWLLISSARRVQMRVSTTFTGRASPLSAKSLSRRGHTPHGQPPEAPISLGGEAGEAGRARPDERFACPTIPWSDSSRCSGWP